MGRALFSLHARTFHGLSFRIAREEDEAALYRFRYRIYCEEGYINPAAYSDGTFSDKYDTVSDNVIALHQDEIVGCGRITHASAIGLPTLEYFNVTLPAGVPYGSVVEMGRFMVVPQFRGRARTVTVGLVVTLKGYLLNHPSVQWLIAFLSEKVCRAFAAFVPFRILDEQPLGASHHQARSLLPGYWQRTDIRAVIARADELLEASARVR